MKRILLSILCVLAFAQSKAIVDSFSIRANPSNSRFRYLNNSPVGSGTNTAGNGMVIARWTAGGTPYTWRSLLKIDLPTMPVGITVDSAFLSLTANVTSPSGNPGYPTWGTDNAVGIYRLTAAWDTTAVSWTTQPAYTTTHGDTLAQSTTWTQSYLHVNVTDLVKDAYTLGNYGFMLKHLQEVATLNSMIFYSPYQYATDTNQAPRLVVYYTAPVSVMRPDGSGPEFDIYPNPATGTVHMDIAEQPAGALTVTVMDCTGRTITTKQIDGTATHLSATIDVAAYAKGIYLVRLQNAHGRIITRKLTIQ